MFYLTKRPAVFWHLHAFTHLHLLLPSWTRNDKRPQFQFENGAPVHDTCYCTVVINENDPHNYHKAWTIIHPEWFIAKNATCRSIRVYVCHRGCHSKLDWASIETHEPQIYEFQQIIHRECGDNFAEHTKNVRATNKGTVTNPGDINLSSRISTCVKLIES